MVSTAVRVIIKQLHRILVQVNQVFSPTVTQLNLDKMAPKFRVRTILNLDRLPNLTTLVLALSTPKVRLKFFLCRLNWYRYYCLARLFGSRMGCPCKITPHAMSL
jgi:hypothetical protein